MGRSAKGKAAPEELASPEKVKRRKQSHVQSPNDLITSARKSIGTASCKGEPSAKRRRESPPQAAAEPDGLRPADLSHSFVRGDGGAAASAVPPVLHHPHHGHALRNHGTVLEAWGQTIFSPVFTLFGHAPRDAHAPEDSNDSAQVHLPAGAGGECDQAAPGASGAAAAAAVAPDVEDGDSEDEYADFDPYAFIKSLPPLDVCVPRDRPLLLPCKTRRARPKTLVLDLDETLVHSTMEALAGEGDFSFPVEFNNVHHNVNVRRRPHLAAFMERVASLFEVVVFTASQRVYAEQLLNVLDPTRTLIRHRVFRDSCVMVEGNYMKDLSVLGRDLAHTVIIDNSPQAFGFQLENGIPIESWFDDQADCELLGLLPFLEKLAEADDVRPLIAREFRLQEKVNAAQPLA